MTEETKEFNEAFPDKKVSFTIFYISQQFGMNVKKLRNWCKFCDIRIGHLAGSKINTLRKKQIRKLFSHMVWVNEKWELNRPRVCIVCDKHFSTIEKNKMFCSDECRQLRKRQIACLSTRRKREKAKKQREQKRKRCEYMKDYLAEKRRIERERQIKAGEEREAKWQREH